MKIVSFRSKPLEELYTTGKSDTMETDLLSGVFMGRSSTPSFVLNVELPTRSDSVLEALCRKKENCGRALYNLVLGLVLRELHRLRDDPRYIDVRQHFA